MCNERERLIEYVYDESDARDREALDRHLESCAECRAEIAALRRVRQDLLAWEVPDRGSVWQPFTPPRVVPSWRDVPAWALAAAASLLLMGGAAGGALTYALLPRPAVVAAAPAPAPAATTVRTVSAADLSALEQRVLATMRTEIDARAQTPAGATAQNVSTKDFEALRQRVNQQLDQVRSQQVDILTAVNSDLRGIRQASYVLAGGAR